MRRSAGTARGAALAAAAAVAGGTVDGTGAFRREALDYDAFLAHREVHRLRGIAGDAPGRTPWTLIEKTTEGPATASPYLRDNAERELAAYTSGLLEELAPRVRAPRLHGAQQEADGRISLWLEEVTDRAPRPLDAPTLLAMSRDLGTVAGRHLGRVTARPWLFSGYIARHAQPEAVAGAWRVLDAATARSGGELDGRLGEVHRLIAAQPQVRAVLESLPSTLCHHDAVGANVLRDEGMTVLLDWESVGPGPAGADLASLLFASVRRGDTSASTVLPLLDDAVDAYLEGMAEETSQVDAAAVRRGVSASICLRWKLAVDVVESLERREPMRRGSAPGETPQEALEELRSLTGLLLDTAARLLDS